MSRKIVKASIQVAVVVLIIKLLGLVKQSAIAMFCGANYQTDLYFLASSFIVQLCSVIFSSITISLLTLYTGEKENVEKQHDLINSVLRIVIPICLAICLLFIFLSDVFAFILAPSYDPEQIATLSNYIKLLAVIFIFNGYFLTINVVLESNKKMVFGKIISLLQNLFTIIAVIFLYNKIGISSLFFAIIASNVISCLLITFRVRKLFKFKLKIVFQKESIKKLLLLSIPLLVGNSMYEINDIIDKQIATNLGDGVVSYLSYGTSINEIIVSLIATSFTSVLFVHYADWAAEKDNERVSKELKKSIELLLFVLLPITAFAAIYRNDIVGVLYGRGQFSESDVLATGSVVLGYSVGFIFQALRADLSRVYYAYKNTTIPMINGIICIAVNIGLSFLLSHFIGIQGVAFATSIAMFLSFVLLLIPLKKYIPEFDYKIDMPNTAKIVLGFIASGCCLFFLRMYVDINKYLNLLIAVSAEALLLLGLFAVFREKYTMYFFSRAKELLFRRKNG